jgi:hypothetical protein
LAAHVRELPNDNNVVKSTPKQTIYKWEFPTARIVFVGSKIFIYVPSDKEVLAANLPY